jgi:hypothetical protein
MGELWVIFLFLIAVAYVVAFTRKGNVRMAMSSSQRELRSPASPDDVVARIRQLGPPYTIDAAEGPVVILSSGVTFASWGFFYPVHVHPEGTGSKIVVGVASKVFQIGPIVTRAHAKCVAAIEAALSIPVARVA